MSFFNTHGTELLVGIIGSLIATGLVALIAWSRKLPPLSVPLWLVAFIVAFPLVWFAVVKLRPPPEPQPVVDQHFEAQRVTIDGKKFIRCNFDRCFLVFKGEMPFGMEGCTFTAPKLIFEGSAAITAFQLGRMRSDPTFEPIVMEAIKKQ